MDKVNAGLKYLDENYPLGKSDFNLIVGIDDSAKIILIKNILENSLNEGKCLLFDLKNNFNIKLNNLITYNNKFDISEIENCCNNYADLKMVVINGFEDITNLQQNDIKFGHITGWRLKVLAKKLNIVIFCTIKLTNEMTQGNKPTIHCLKYFGCVEEDADQIYFVDKIKNIDKNHALIEICRPEYRNFEKFSFRANLKI